MEFFIAERTSFLEWANCARKLCLGLFSRSYRALTLEQPLPVCPTRNVLSTFGSIVDSTSSQGV